MFVVGQRYNKKLEFMCKSRIFAEILNIVSTETEVPEECILSSRKDEDTVDARYLLVYFLSKQGFSHSGIAKLINKDVRTVNYIITHFPDREKSGKFLELIRRISGNR